ncbi:MAG: hypothetical protein AB7T49_08150 [Oligoflexales bacterium]
MEDHPVTQIIDGEQFTDTELSYLAPSEQRPHEKKHPITSAILFIAISVCVLAAILHFVAFP